MVIQKAQVIKKRSYSVTVFVKKNCDNGLKIYLFSTY